MEVEVPATTTSHISSDRFSNLNISKNTLRAIDEKFKYDNMTIVQSQSINPILEGYDVFVKAKTGTGKTIGVSFFALRSMLLLYLNNYVLVSGASD